MPDERVTLREAAIRLGVSEGAIRKRVARGTIRSEMGDDGLRYVWVDGGADGGAYASYTHPTDRDELVDELREQVSYLRSQLGVRAEEIQRRDVIISQLTQATSNLTDRLRELEAPSAGATPAPDGAVEEGMKEFARRLFGAAFGLAVFIPSAISAVISYVNDAPTLTIVSAASAVFGAITALVGTYFGIKVSSDTADRAQSVIKTASDRAQKTNAAAAERATQDAHRGERDDG